MAKLCSGSAEVCNLSDTMFALSVLCFFLGPYLIWKFRKTVIMSVRFPYMVVTEVAIGMLKSLMIDMIYGSMGILVNSIPCFLMAGFRNGIDFPMRMATSARLCMFYLQALSNMGESKVDSRMLPYVKVLAFVCAPAEYKQFLKRIEGKDHASSSSQHAKKPEMFPGWRRYAVCIAAWWFFGYLLNDIVSFSIYSVDVNVRGVGKSICWIPQLKVIASWSVIWSLFHLPMLYAIWHVEDAIGLKNQLFWSLVIEIVAGISNGAALFNFNFNSLGNRAWAELSLFIPPFLSFVVPVAYLARFQVLKKRAKKAQQSSGESTVLSEENGSTTGGAVRSNASVAAQTKSPKTVAFEKFWRGRGREQINDLARKHFIHECTQFLTETDSMSMNPEELTEKRFKDVYSTYVKTGAAFEVNLPSKIKNQFVKLVEEGSKDIEVIDEARLEIIKLLMENLRPYLDLSHIPEFRRANSSSQGVNVGVEITTIPGDVKV